MFRRSESTHEAAATGFFDSSPAAMVPTDAGTRLKYFGDYELLGEIARGGMGVVWKARQSTLNRDVALKMICTGVLASPEEVARFLREAEAAANLQHPNIVAIHEVGEHGGQHYFSMDFVAGRDLGAIVEDGPLLPQRAARYVKIIAEAIHFAHQRGTLHRDLKPQNVLIDAADQPRITDFGVAKIMKNDSQLTQTGVVMGSPSYMPPEQAAGRHGDIGPASDVYSLGAMLYELLTGRPPFRGATALATMRDVMEAEPTAPRRLLLTIPPDLETICLKCLEKSPSVRYPTARALAEELDRFLKGEPILARPAGTVRKVVNWARRHPNVLVALAALVVVALAISVFYLWEENAFLRAQQADPSLARILGPRYESFRLWCRINGYVLLGGFVLLFVWRPLPIGVRTPAFAIAAGLILVGSGVMVLVTGIQVYVWECESWSGQVFGPWAVGLLSIECGLITLGMVIQHYHLANYGPSSKSSRPLTAEQIEQIRCAFEDDDWIAAVKRYREAVPNAGFTEALQYVAHLRELLRAQHPDKNDPPPLSLATLLKDGDHIMNARFRNYTLPFIVLATIASAGCVPTVSWLPDSGGIIYTTTDWPGLDNDSAIIARKGGRWMPKERQGLLIHYDLKTKSTRIIAKAETNTIQPALSPNGKQIAVARVNLEKDKQTTLLVMVYDLAGKEIQRSKLFEWGGVPKYDTEVGGIQKYSHLFWAPHENKVLVYANNRSGIYDLGKDRVVMLGHARPSIFGTTPVRPDGKGFLLVKGDPGFLEPGVRSEALAFVDWDGRESAIAMPVGRLDVRVHDILYAPASSWSRWDGDVAIATWKSQEWRIDTARKTADLQNVDEAVWALDGKEIQQICTFSNGKTKLAVICLENAQYSKKLRVDLIGPEADRQRTLIEMTPYCGVYPSPNHELVALRYMSKGKTEKDRPRDMILVVNAKGEAVADFEAGK